MTDPASWASHARQLADQGDDAAADAQFEAGLRQFPDNARFANSAGNFHARAGRTERALELFERACLLDPALDEARYNQALMLVRLGRWEEVRQLAQERVEAGAAPARFHAMLGDASRETRAFDQAQRAYAAALALEPGNLRALAGRARLSLERGEARAVADYEAALARNPTDPHLFRNYSEALWEAGLIDDAIQCATALVTQVPDWPDGHVQLAEFLWSKGETTTFDQHFAQAAPTAPSPAIHLAWASVLSGVDRHGAAAEVLQQAGERWPDNADVALSLGIALSEAGRTGDATAVFERWSGAVAADWQVARARNRLRSGDVDEAERLLSGVIDPRTGDISAWALIDLCWRLQQDPRHEWLHGQDGLVRMLVLPIAPDALLRARACLEQLHAASGPPVGQSVKDGRQTKGALFARMEPELAQVAQGVRDMLEEYRQGLPPIDERHPLLCRRSDDWSVVGSWSIRLSGQGRHAAHIHPLGMLSSACYFDVPAEVEEASQPGWLELGRPPATLATGLPPLHVFKPVVGSCAVFPSTLFHSTRPISRGNRMTVAFDVKPAGRHRN